MERIKQDFWRRLEGEMTATLASCSDDCVTMRVVSLVEYEGKALFFTDRASKKYRQLEQNPRCCVGMGTYFAEAVASFRGPAMAQENAKLREAYEKKFPGAFAEGVEFGGRSSDFVLLSFTKLSGWAYPEERIEGVDFPTVPFEFEL